MDLILAVIIACEIGFWIFVVLGLVTRYVLRLRRTGAALLAMTPVVDLVLLAAVVINLRGGGAATTAHGLAALYLGISVAYGHTMIKWADVRFAHRFARGPRPIKLHGWAYTRECWRDVVRTALAVSIAAGILFVLTAVVGDPDRTAALTGLYPPLGIWLAVEVIWAVSYTFSPKKEPATARSMAPSR